MKDTDLCVRFGIELAHVGLHLLDEQKWLTKRFGDFLQAAGAFAGARKDGDGYAISEPGVVELTHVDVEKAHFHGGGGPAAFNGVQEWPYLKVEASFHPDDDRRYVFLEKVVALAKELGIRTKLEEDRRSYRGTW